MLFVVLYVAWCATLFFLQDRMLFLPDLAPQPTPLLYSTGTEQLVRRVAGVGDVVAWFIPAPGLTAEAPAPLVIYLHGNAEIIDYQDLAIQGYQKLGCSILLPEYRGYGRSAGEPSEAAIVEDAEYFYDVVTQRSDVDAARVVFHGRSLGGGAAAQLALRRGPTILILESTFQSVAAMARKYGVPGFLARHPFRSDRAVERLSLPLLILHGENDELIPVSHGRRLRDLADDVTYIEYDCGHNDFPGAGNEAAYWAEIEAFLRRHAVIPAAIP